MNQYISMLGSLTVLVALGVGLVHTQEPKLGDPCSNITSGAEESCFPGGVCSPEGVCECADLSQWDSVRGRCRLRVDSPCIPNDQANTCLDNAECSDGACACKDGYRKQFIPVGSRYIETCHLRGSLGAWCIPESDCTNFTRCSYAQDRVPQCTCDGDWSESDSMCQNDGYCVAIHFTGSFYDTVAHQCKCQIGRTCMGRQDQRLELENCPAGATPNAVGDKCECGPGLVAVGDGRVCVPHKRYGEQCEFEGQCISGAHCHTGLCQCNGTVWNRAIGKCMLKSGERCRPEGDQCTPNTECTLTQNGWEHSCVCPSEFNVTATGECAVLHGARCHAHSNCAPQLQCIGGACACRDLVGHVYDAERETCFALVGARCTPDGAVDCVTGAGCDSATSTCRCDPGTVPARHNGRCFRALYHGANCTGQECDPKKGLVCSGGDNGTCICVDSGMVYNKLLQACVSPPGSKCGNFTISGSCLPAVGGGEAALCEEYVLSCAPGSECSSDGARGGNCEEAA